jgi:hypothetical protein
MKASLELFDLIRSLSQTEKAYFKRYSKLHVRGKSNNYVLLFDAIEKQKEYNEPALLLKFKGHGFVRQFSVAKNYLYNQVLNSMHYYHHSVHSEVKKLIHQAEFLIEKGLFKQAKKIIDKGKLLAEKSELHWALIELNHQWEYRMAITKYDWVKIRQLSNEAMNRKSLFENLLSYRHMYITVAGHYKRYNKDTKTDFIKKIYKSKDYNAGNAKTFRSKVLFFQAHFINAYYSGQQAKAYSYLFKKIALYDSIPGKIDQEPFYYGTSIHNAITLSYNLRSYDKIPHLLNKMKSTIGLCRNEVQRRNLSYLFSSQQLSYFLRIADFDQAIVAAKVITKEWDMLGAKVNSIEMAGLLLNVSLAYFIVGDFKNCVRILNCIHNEFSFTTNAEDESFFRIFRLIVHFEAGNYDVLPYFIQSTYRFLKKKERLRKFEKILINFLQRMLSQNANRDIMKDLMRVKDQIDLQVKKEYEENISLKFDIVGWLESKIENKPYIEILKRKLPKESSERDRS